MNTIWKFELEIVDEQVIAMPEFASILCAQEQGGKLCLWAKVVTDKKLENRVIRIIGTGNPVHDADQMVGYIDTVQIGKFVWHVFEKLSKADIAKLTRTMRTAKFVPMDLTPLNN